MSGKKRRGGKRQAEDCFNDHQPNLEYEEEDEDFVFDSNESALCIIDPRNNSKRLKTLKRKLRSKMGNYSKKMMKLEAINRKRALLDNSLMLSIDDIILHFWYAIQKTKFYCFNIFSYS